MKIVHIIAKYLTGDTHVERWSKFIQQVNQKFAEADKLIGTICIDHGELGAAEAAFMENPSAKTLEAVFAAASRKTVSVHVVQDLRALVDDRRNSMIKSRRDLLELACSEVLNALESARKDVIQKARDVETESGGSIDESKLCRDIDMRIKNLKGSLSFFEIDPSFIQARGGLKGVLDTTDPI